MGESPTDDRPRGPRGRWRWGRGLAEPLTLAVVVVALTLTEVAQHRGFVHPDRLIAEAAGRDLVGAAGLHVYSVHPQAQMGPLALLLALLPRPLGARLVAALVAVPVVAVLAALPRSRRRIAVAYAPLFALPWAQLAWKGHADDALVLAGGTAALALAARGRRGWVFVAVATALAAKPTALAFAVAVLPDLGVLAVAAAMALTWGPFVVADLGGVLHAGRGIMPVGAGSLPDLLGDPVGAPIPVWVRLMQLLGGTAAAACGRLRGNPWDGVLLAFTVRALVETNPAPAYAIPLVVLGVVPDARARVPWRTPVAFVSWWAAQGTLDTGQGWPRIVLLAVLGLGAWRGACWAACARPRQTLSTLSTLSTLLNLSTLPPTSPTGRDRSASPGTPRAAGSARPGGPGCGCPAAPCRTASTATPGRRSATS